MEDKKAKEKLTPAIDLLESSIKLWWQNLAKFILASAWGFIYSLIPMALILLFYFLGYKVFSLAYFGAIFYLLLFLGFCVIFYFLIRSYMTLFLLIKRNYEGNPLTVFKETRSLFWPYLGLVLLTALLVLLWSCLFIIPGIIFSIFYSFAAYAFFFEDKRGGKAIKRSQELVKGYFWPIIGRFLLLFIVLWTAEILITIPLSKLAVESLAWNFYYYFVQVFNFIITPISILFSYQIFKDLARIKK